MKILSMLVAVASMGFATIAQAGSEKSVVTDVNVYVIETSQSEQTVSDILQNATDVRFSKQSQIIPRAFTFSGNNMQEQTLTNALSKIGKISKHYSKTVTTGEGQESSVEFSETHTLLNGSINGKPRTKDLKTGIFLKIGPSLVPDKSKTLDPNSHDFILDAKLNVIELTDVKKRVIDGSARDMSKVASEEYEVNTVIRKDNRLLIFNYLGNAVKSVLGNKNKVFIAVLNPSIK